MGKKRNIKYDLAYERYLAGLSLSQVASEMGVTRQSVFKAFSQRGFQLRGKNFRPEQFFDGKKFTLKNTGYYAMTDNERMLMHRYVWEFYNGEIPPKHDIHHINHNRSDNRIENLELYTKSEHARKFSKENREVSKCK